MAGKKGDEEEKAENKRSKTKDWIAAASRGHGGSEDSDTLA